jgi:hypothetical protein
MNALGGPDPTAPAPSPSAPTPCRRHLDTEFASILHELALFGPRFELMLRGNKGDEHD